MRSVNGTPFTVDSDATPDAVLVEYPCRRVIVFENTSSPTTEFDAYEPYNTSSTRRRGIGQEHVFDAGENALFAVGVACGYLKAVTAGTYSFGRRYE